MSKCVDRHTIYNLDLGSTTGADSLHSLGQSPSHSNIGYKSGRSTIVS